MASAQSRTKTGTEVKDLDKEVVWEFGGPIGTGMVMIGSPLMMYYCWICLEFYRGELQYPSHPYDTLFFLDRMWGHVSQGARPTLYTVKLYTLFVVFEAFLAMVMPGPEVKGLPVPSEGNRVLKYYCNGMSTFYTTLATAAALHFSGVFPLTEIVDNFGPLMTTAIIAGYLVTFAVYIMAYLLGKQYRMSGNIIYDMFMGAWLNPRIGRLDLKLFVEIRIPWVLLFFISLSSALKSYQLNGVVTAPSVFMVLAHLLYVNACHKGEECVVTTWDVFYEKFGFMLIFWNLAGVPFVYCHSSYYLLRAGPITHSLPYTVFCFTLLLSAYYVWDTANSQKNRFRMQRRGTYVPRRAFPQLPWGTLSNPSYITTSQGSVLLTGGWWAYARKIHYTADILMSLGWGLITGFGSWLPYFYVTFFFSVLMHRTLRDMDRCAKKYGADWVTYCKKVPYLFIPGVF